MDKIIISDNWDDVLFIKEDNDTSEEYPGIVVSKTIGNIKTFDIPGLGKI